MLCHVEWLIGADVSKENIANIYRLVLYNILHEIRKRKAN